MESGGLLSPEDYGREGLLPMEEISDNRLQPVSDYRRGLQPSHSELRPAYRKTGFSRCRTRGVASALYEGCWDQVIPGSINLPAPGLCHSGLRAGIQCFESVSPLRGFAGVMVPVRGVELAALVTRPSL